MIAVERESGAKTPTPTPSPLYTSTANPSSEGIPATESQTFLHVTLGQRQRTKSSGDLTRRSAAENYPPAIKNINIPESPDSLKRLPSAKDAQGSDMSCCMRR